MKQFPPVSLIGVPTDIGAGHRGAAMGPEALRVAGIAEALLERGLNVVDRGNLSGPLNPWQLPVNGYRHLAEVVAWNQLVMQAVYSELNMQRLPVLLGGDHCLGIGSITAVARWCRERNKKLMVLWLDAHADFNTSTLTPTGNIHGMPVAIDEAVAKIRFVDFDLIRGAASKMIDDNPRVVIQSDPSR